MICFTKIDYIKYTILGMFCMYILLFLFYDSFIISAIGSLAGILFVKVMKLYRLNQQKRAIKKQFKECLHAISTSISVGKSIENAFDMAYEDLSMLYSEEVFIMVEIKKIIAKVAMNTPIESALYEFALRANDEDISNFVTIFMASKRTGGNLREIMQSTSAVIHDKIEFLDNIYVLVTGKKFEHMIMMVLLPLFIFYLRINAADFIQVMYTTLVGRMVMSLSLLLYATSFYIGYKIVSLEV